jgi:cell division protein FtsZ
MTLKLSMPEVTELKPRITVIGVGGAGGNAVNNMISTQLEGVEFIATNTDAQALSHTLTERRIQLGVNATQGLGAGSRPEIGREAALEALDEIMDHIQGSHMVFITAGMGGGTGTGAAPVIAKAAREQGILTVGVVTKPFHFEGSRRMETAEAGIAELQGYVDTLIIIPNQNLFRVANERTTFADAFCMADEVLAQGVRGVTDLMVMPGLINLDFADVRAVMSEMGKAMMGTGEAEGEKRAIDAAEAAISNPLLEDVTMKGATGVLINITGGPDMTLFEVDEAANRIREEVEPNANIIFGSTFDPELEGRMRVSIIATGIDSAALAQTPPLPMPRLQVVGGRQTSKPAVADRATDPVITETAASTPVAAESRAEPAPGGTSPVMGEPAAWLSEPADAGMPASTGDEQDRDEAEVEASIGAMVESLTRPDNEAAPDGGVEATSPQVPVSEPAVAAATPRPVAREDAFIPPRPMEAPVRERSLGKPEPFAEAAMANGGKTAQKRSEHPSLLERMTGTGRARRRTEPEVSSPRPAAPAPPADDDLLDIPAFLRRQAN